MEVRDIVFYSAKEISYLKGVINNAITPCVNDWKNNLSVSISHLAQSNCLDIDASDVDSFFIYESGSGMSVLANISEKNIQAIASLLIGVDKDIKPSAITSKMAGDFLLEIVQSISLKLHSRELTEDAVQLETAFSVAERKPVGIGNITVTIQLNNCHFKLLLNQPLVASLLSSFSDDNTDYVSSEPLTKYSTLLTDRKVTLEVQIGFMELTVASLASLQVNDVIHLDKNISETVTMKVLDTDVVCKGYPVQCEGKKALRLVS